MVSRLLLLCGATGWRTFSHKHMIISFGQSVHERLEMDVVRYEREKDADFWDENWMVVDVRVRTGGFRAKVAATFVINEMADFLGELRPLSEAGKGTAEFKALDNQLKLRLAAHGKGQIDLHGEIHDPAEPANRLHFILHFDQQHLGHTIEELQKLVSDCRARETTRKHRRIRPE